MADTGERLAPVIPLFSASESVPASVPVSESPVDDLEPSSRSGKVFDRISNVSMHALSRRGTSRQEMVTYLLGREFEENDVEVEVERLISVGLLDDFALAETLSETLRRRKALGRSGVSAELRRRRVDPVAIEQVLSELDDDNELTRAVEIAHKRARQLTALDPATAQRRLSSFLQRRGYSGTTVSQAVKSALEPTGPSFR